MINHFFKKKGPFNIKQLADLIDITLHNSLLIDNEILDIKDLFEANKSDITFFHSKKYENLASKTEASFCVTTENLSHILPNSCYTIVVENVLIATAKITKIFYPTSVTDDFDQNVYYINETPLSKKVKHGKHVLVGENVQVGKNCFIGHNYQRVTCSVGDPLEYWEFYCLLIIFIHQVFEPNSQHQFVVISV